jgi:hypothetical protein
MASLEFTPIVPIVSGTAFATAAVVDGSDEYDYIPISSNTRTIVVIKNTHGSSTKTVTFTSQADEWDNTGASLNKVITVPALTTVITGVWLRNRWGDANTPTNAAYTCTVAYQTAANIEIAVINVPNASKD